MEEKYRSYLALMDALREGLARLTELANQKTAAVRQDNLMALDEVLKQEQNSPLAVEEQVVIIYAVINNYLASIEIEQIRQYQKDLITHIRNEKPEIFESIKTEKVMTPETEEAVKEVLTSFAASYAG